ncbi:MAG: leucine-rich repeat domain-containing protein [Clostridia bacterium]|nr:leucine-rich repeat domain-containing protein [Clostridia bacterium]
MKRKLLFFLAMTAMLVCIFAISVSAATLTNYASVKLTLVDGTEKTGYCEINGRFLRDNVYKNPENTDEGTYAWENIKVFDMRGSVIVGTNTYNEVGGVNCNKQAANVEKFYFSSQVTKILNTTFTSDWKSLKTVYIPNTVTEIHNDSFKQSAVQQVIIEEGSQLKSIGANAFQECSNLKTFDFPEGLESLGRNCFWNAGLSGTIVIPNSVTYLAPGSLLSTKIENLYLGDGALEIGHNFAGTYQATNNEYLKNVYMPATTKLTVDGGSKIFFKCANPVNFYIVGTKEECEAMVATLKAQSTGSYLTFITADEATKETTAGYGIIYTGYNRCDAFYNGEHLTAEQAYEFTSFMEKSYVKSTCPRCEQGTVLKEIAALFDCLGYSAPEDGTGGIAIGFTVNNVAIAEYEEIAGKTLKYGVFAVLKDRLGNNDIFGEDGKASEGVISAEITNYEFAAFEIKIVGFTDTQKDTKLAMGTYVSVTDGETTEYSYMQGGEPNENEKYCFVSYNDIVGAPSTDEEVTQ